jgi:hypothetical protein
VELKTCAKCGEDKLLGSFYFRRDTRKYRSECQECRSKRVSEYRIKNHDTVIEYERKKYADNRGAKLESKKRYYKAHRSEVIKRCVAYKARRLKECPAFKIKELLRDRLRKAILGRAKRGSAVNDLGCSVEALIAKFEVLFYTNKVTNEQMNWLNYGTGWHIDHIIPLSYFNLTDSIQFKIACNHMNLQPMWSEENEEKSNKIPENAEILIAKIKESIEETEINEIGDLNHG